MCIHALAIILTPQILAVLVGPVLENQSRLSIARFVVLAFVKSSITHVPYLAYKTA